MPRRYGKGKDMTAQATAVLKKYKKIGVSRHDVKKKQGLKGAKSTGFIHSQRTGIEYAGALGRAGDWLKNSRGIRHINDITVDMAKEYLEYRAAMGLTQNTVNRDRHALSFVVKEEIPRVRTFNRQKSSGRAYTSRQAKEIAKHQNERNALATEIAFAAGLRAHELLTLRRNNEASKSSHRTWRDERFFGRDGVIYIVKGKGGLYREVIIPARLAEKLERRRLAEERTVKDKGVMYRSLYDIGGGNAWSASVSRASNFALGWSTGAHGFRHSYVQNRMDILRGYAISEEDAKEIVSQEIGHFRPDITNVYLR